MSILTGKPSTLTVGNTSSVITLSRSTLISQMSITDPYWSDSTNWQQVFFQYQDNTGLQHRSLTFGASDTATFFVSAHAKQNTWQAKSIVIIDYDGGTYSIPRASFTSATEFDITIAGVFGSGDLRPERTDPWSMSFWVKRASVGSAQTIFTTRTNDSIKKGIELAFLGSNQFEVYLTVDDNTSALQAGVANMITDTTTWHHVVVTYAASAFTSADVKVYLDGVSKTILNGDGGTPLTGTIIGAGQQRIGATNGNTQFLDALMDEITFYRGHVLSAGEVTSLYNSGTLTDPSSLSTAQYINMWLRGGDNGLSPADSWTSGAGTVYDRSGNNHDGAHTGTSSGFSTTVPTGSFSDHSMSFNGTDDYLILS